MTINEIYEDDFLIHIVMEYLGGGDLYERINQQRSLFGYASELAPNEQSMKLLA